MANKLGGFLDLTASDLIGQYTELQKIKAGLGTQKVQQSTAAQDQALHSSDYTSGSEAISGGNAQVPGAAAAPASYWDRVPKPLLYGSVGLLGLGLVLKAIK
ncbi:hypothetical protein [Microbulbifer sp. ARAS458-1]|uniref:hypothetical protein n=1 Tax=Microbulbifer sp. ARAS458-1 TaxID=3140242 RepID=UPI003877FD73